MKFQIDQVQTFHEAFGAPVGGTPGICTPERLLLRCNLILEEAKEFLEASNVYVHTIWNDTAASKQELRTSENGSPDLVLMSDALMDLLYVTFGTLVELGLQDRATAMFNHVHESNMSKLGTDGKPILREDGKILKGPGFFKPNLAQFLP